MTTGIGSRRAVLLGTVVLTGAILLIGTGPGAAVGMAPIQTGAMPMDGGHMAGHAGPMMWWMPVVMGILWVGLLVGVGYLLYRSLRSGTASDSALDELDRAFARGEISEEEYDRRRERLET